MTKKEQDLMLLNIIIDGLKKQSEYEDGICKFINSISDTSCVLNTTPAEQALYDIAERILTGNPDPKDDWFSWFVFDNDFGNEKLVVYGFDQKEYVIDTIEKLYDFLHDFD